MAIAGTIPNTRWQVYKYVLVNEGQGQFYTLAYVSQHETFAGAVQHAGRMSLNGSLVKIISEPNHAIDGSFDEFAGEEYLNLLESELEDGLFS